MPKRLGTGLVTDAVRQLAQETLGRLRISGEEKGAEGKLSELSFYRRARERGAENMPWHVHPCSTWLRYCIKMGEW